VHEESFSCQRRTLETLGCRFKARIGLDQLHPLLQLRLAMENISPN